MSAPRATPSRLAVLVPVEETISGIGAVAGDPGQAQRRRVGGADVVAHADEHHRVIGRNDVEVGTGRMPPLGQTSVVIAAPEDPRPGRSGGDRLADEGLQIGDGGVALWGEIQIKQCETDRHRVGVGVVQSRGRGSPRQIDDR